MWGQGCSLNCFTSSSSSVVGNSQTAVVRGCTGSAIRAHSKAWQLSKLSLLILRNCSMPQDAEKKNKNHEELWAIQVCWSDC